MIKQNVFNENDLDFYDHHLIRGSRILRVEKLTSKEMYGIIFKVVSKPSSNLYF